MATLVLNALGMAVAGPAGAAVGSLIGSMIDRELIFKPKGRKGARLKDLAVQSSQYGAAIPRIYGRMRVAGTVIWATDFKEEKHRQGGKGQPTTTNYSYSVSLAVALSSRPIKGIGRIWADGNIMRGADGELKYDCTTRLYHGYADQQADPLIAAHHGDTPHYSDMAYMVFEDLQLADFGNHIPNMTFEVFADDDNIAGEVMLHDIIADIIPPAYLAAHNLAVIDDARCTGCALDMDSIAQALSLLSSGWPLTCHGHADGLEITAALDKAGISGNDDGVIALSRHDFATSKEQGDSRFPSRKAGQYRRNAAHSMPSSLNLRYYDPARDYQAGLRQAHMADGWLMAGRTAHNIDLPFALDVATAQHRAEKLASHFQQQRDRLTVHIMVMDKAIKPGAVLQCEGYAGYWIVQSWQWQGQFMTLELEAHMRSAGHAIFGQLDSGSAITAPDHAIGETVFALFDLPSAFDEAAIAPRLAIAANGKEAGWRGAQILSSDGEGAPFEFLTQMRQKHIVGHALNALPTANMLLPDRVNMLDIMLPDSLDIGQVFAQADDRAMANGANLAVLGGEVLQFGVVTPLGGNRIRLSHLWRGRGGTEDKAHGHYVGEPFMLIGADLELADTAKLLQRPGQAVRLYAQGRGDATAKMAELADYGRAMRPLSPVHGRFHYDGEDIAVQWIWRSRHGLSWHNGRETPEDEAGQYWQVQLRRGNALLASQYVNQPQAKFARALLSETPDANSDALLSYAEIYQIGTMGVSPPLLIPLRR